MPVLQSEAHPCSLTVFFASRVHLPKYCEQAKEDEDWEFTSTLTAKLQQQDILLDIVSIDMPDLDSKHQGDKTSNREALCHILPHARHSLRSVRTPGEILSAFTFKEFGTQAYYSGPLTIANKMTIAVKVQH